MDRKKSFRKMFCSRKFQIVFLSIFCLSLILTGILFYRVYGREKGVLVKDEILLSRVEVEKKRALLKNYILAKEDIVFALSRNELALDYITREDTSSKRAFSLLMFGMAFSNRGVIEITYINSSGVEEIKVEQFGSSGDHSIVEDKELSEKSSSDYFTMTRELINGDIWHSNIGLYSGNRPYFAVSTPIYIDGLFKGVIVIFFEASEILEKLTLSPDFDIYICDGRGESIISPLLNASWSRYLDGSRSFREIFPYEIENIISGKDYIGHGIYSYDLGYLFRNREGLKIVFIPLVRE